MTNARMVTAIAAVLANDGQKFTRLVEVGGLDPARDFRQTSLAGLSFAGQDMRPFDFTGSDLTSCRWDGALISTTVLEGATFDKAAVRQADDWAERDDRYELSGEDDRKAVTDVRPLDLPGARALLEEQATGIGHLNKEDAFGGLRDLYAGLSLPERLFMYRRIFSTFRHLRNEALSALVDGPEMRLAFRTHPHFKYIQGSSSDTLVTDLQDPESSMYGLTILGTLYRRGAMPINLAVHPLVETILYTGIEVGDRDGQLVKSLPPLSTDIHRWESGLVWSALRAHRAVDDIEIAGLIIRAPSRHVALEEAARMAASDLRLSPHAVLGLAIQFFPDLSQSLQSSRAAPETKRLELGSTDLGDLLRLITLNAVMEILPSPADVAMVERLLRRRRIEENS